MTGTKITSQNIFTNKQKNLLESLNISSMDHLAALAIQPESLELLAEFLQINLSALNNLKNLLATFMPGNADSFALQESRADKVFGLLISEEPFGAPPMEFNAFLRGLDLPVKGSVLKQTLRTGIRDQGNRGTCVAMAAVKAYEAVLDAPSPLSPQFLYNMCKQVDGVTDKEGTFIHTALDVLNEHGCCLEKSFPYNPLKVPGPEGGTPPSAAAIKEACRFKTNRGVISFKGKDGLLLVKASISGKLAPAPRPIIGGVSIFPSFNNSYTRRTGIVNFPIPGEKAIGGHAVVLSGFADDSKAPGGGSLVFVNSYGETWAAESPHSPGVGEIPYNYIEEHMHSAGMLLLKDETLNFSFGRQPETPEREPLYIRADSSDNLEEDKNISPENGFILGKSHDKNQDIIWQPFMLPNTHMIVSGGSGEGKSQFVKSWIYKRLNMSDASGIHVFDLHQEYSDVLGLVAANSNVDDVALVDVTATGFPFRLLERQGALPDDIRVENILHDLRAASPQMGNVQADTIRRILLEGLVLGWENVDLRDRFEDIDDPNLKSQIYPILLLLRANSARMTEVLDKRLVIHDLSNFHDPVSRAAYAISFLSQLMQNRMMLRQNNGLDGARSLSVVFEEAPLLAKAHIQLERFFQEARKMRCSGIFVSQQWSAIPHFVSRNAATSILFRSAAIEAKKNKTKERMPAEIGEAIVSLPDREISARLNLFHEECKSTVADFSHLFASQESGIKEQGPISFSKSIKLGSRLFVKPFAGENLYKWIASFFSEQTMQRCWYRLLLFELDNNASLLWDQKKKLPVIAIEPQVAHLTAWQHIPANLSTITKIQKNDLKKTGGPKSNLIKKGIAVMSNGQLCLSKELQALPKIDLPGKLVSELPPGWPHPGESPELTADQLEMIRLVAGTIWGVGLNQAPREVLLPVYCKDENVEVCEMIPAWRRSELL